SASLIRSKLFYTLGSLGNDAETLKHAAAIAAQVLEDPEQVSPELAAQSLMLAALEGDAKLHEGLVQVLGTTRSPALREAVVRALAAFRNPELLGRTYALLLNGTLRAQDYYPLPRSAARGEATQATFWTWYVKHEQDLIRLLGARMAGSLPWVAAGFCSEAGIEAARQHFGNLDRLGPGAQTNLDQALETATRCLNLRQMVEPTLKDQVGALTPTR
ncbi:MAG TPA: ERAP1-like C-terminal domain-containing protein, partial [Polyangiaceae bacterium]|nr:ERAP1-like C-terminal domain-containing protein [Polyangiaceae bacterium]